MAVGADSISRKTVMKRWNSRVAGETKLGCALMGQHMLVD